MRYVELAIVGCALVGSLLSGCAAQTAAAAGTHPQPSAASELHIPAQLTAQLHRISIELARAGLQPARRAFAGFLPGGNHATYPLHLQAGTCTTLVALATRNVRDVDAALYTPDGDLLAVDSEPDPHPTIQVCAEADQDVYYVLQLIDGDGSFVVLPFFGPRATLATAGRVLGGRPVVVEAVAAREVSEDPITSLLEGMRKRGFVQARAPEDILVSDQERVRTVLSARAGDCYTLAAFGQSGVQELGLRVLDGRGELLAEQEDARHERAALQFCAHATGDYAVELEARAGAGHVLLMTFRADVATAGGEDGLWLGKRADEH